MEKTWSFMICKFLLLLFMITIIHQPSSARILFHINNDDMPYLPPPPPPPPPPLPPPPHYLTHKPITFFMEDILSNTNHHHLPPPPPFSTPQTVNGQQPFPKPMTHFPSQTVNPLLPKPNPKAHTFSSSIPGHQTFDPSVIGLPFPPIATLQELEHGSVTPINENLIEGPDPFGSPILFGKSKGVYVKSPHDDHGHMMAINVMFVNGGFKDSLRFFGVHKSSDSAASESHIAVIGGTGKYHGANGYATVKTVTIGFNQQETSKGYTFKKLLMFTVYLSY